MKALKRKSNGTEVRVLQFFLDVSADGIFGAKTEAAVNNWKEKNGMEKDGVFSESDWNLIAAQMPELKVGSRGKEVKMWQAFLGVDVDGIFGTKTRASTRAYQIASKLIITGIVTKEVWKVAFSAAAAPAPKTSGTNTKKPVDYKQYDSRWGSVKYSTHTKSQTIKNSGCGPTSMADIVATWWNKNITPRELCALSVQKGYRTYNSGTAWTFFRYCAEKYGASKFVQTTSVETLKNALNNGALAVVSFGPSRWTKSGHFCCIWKWDGKYFYINDPASAASNRAKGTSSEVQKARKQFFIFYK